MLADRVAVTDDVGLADTVTDIVPLLELVVVAVAVGLALAVQSLSPVDSSFSTGEHRCAVSP